MNPEEAAERAALGKIAHALREYQTDSNHEINRWEYNYSRLSLPHQSLLAHLPPKIAAARQAVYQNSLFFNSLLQTLSPDHNPAAPPSLSCANQAADEYAALHSNQVSPGDADKVRYVLKNLARDWSQEGAEERAQSYGRITQQLVSLLLEDSRNNGGEEQHPPSSSSPPPPYVLVPGCGLGRLIFDLACQGFDAIGNEFSYYMLLTSQFILNNTNRAEEWAIHPWVLSTSNQTSDGNQLRALHIPDIHPSTATISSMGSMGMCAGDFVDSFSPSSNPEFEGAFDAVATCFFIDTAHNIVEYIEVIHKILRPGGYWVNLGPLLYHWADSVVTGDVSRDEMSVELSLGEVERVVRGVGFRFVGTREMVGATYMVDGKSMLRPYYECAFWTVQKV